MLILGYGFIQRIANFGDSDGILRHALTFFEYRMYSLRSGKLCSLAVSFRVRDAGLPFPGVAARDDAHGVFNAVFNIFNLVRFRLAPQRVGYGINTGLFHHGFLRKQEAATE